MSLLKNFIKLLETVPASKPILHQIEEIVHSLMRNSPLAKSKDLRQQVLNAKNAYNRNATDIKKVYNPDNVSNQFDPLDEIIINNMSRNKTQKSPHPTGDRLTGGGFNPRNGDGGMLGGGLGNLWN